MADHVHSNKSGTVNLSLTRWRANGRDLMNKINSFLKGCWALLLRLRALFMALEDFFFGDAMKKNKKKPV